MILLFDVGNTHTHLGLANPSRVVKHVNLRTADWFDGRARPQLQKFAGRARLEGAALCSVVPTATAFVLHTVKTLWRFSCLELGPKTLHGVGIKYPKPGTIGPDRLANALAARHRYGAPVVVVDFARAVTFDVVDRRGNYVGGIISPGLAAMTGLPAREDRAATTDRDPGNQERHWQEY